MKVELKNKPNTKVYLAGEKKEVFLYKTCIVTVDEGKRTVKLRTGGWATPTTFRRMNEALEEFGIACHVSSKGISNNSDYEVTLD